MERIKNLYLCEFPLRNNEEYTAIVSAEGRAVFDWLWNDVDESFAAAVIDKLNGRAIGGFSGEFTAQEESIVYDGCRILDIRGWGWLKDVCGLTGSEASAEQEEFVRWCVHRLNGTAPMHLRRRGSEFMKYAKQYI